VAGIGQCFDVSDLEHGPVLPGRIHQGPALGERFRRFLAEHVLARFHRHQRHRHVPMVGR